MYLTETEFNMFGEGILFEDVSGIILKMFAVKGESDGRTTDDGMNNYITLKTDKEIRKRYF